MKPVSTKCIPEIPFPLKKWNGERFAKNLVYLFFFNGEVVYVGATHCLSSRESDSVRQHYKRDEIWYVETGTRGEALDCEAWLIEELEPRFNKLRHGRGAPPLPYPPFFLYGQLINFGAEARKAAA